MDSKNCKSKDVPMPNMKSLLMSVLGVLLALAIVLPLSVAIAAADSYPSKPVRLIIPFAPGGGTDIVGRMIATKLSERLGKQVVPDNRAGAGGVLGMEIAAKSEPDGYTLLFTDSSFAINSSLYKLPYDPAKDLVPIAMAGSGPVALVVHPGVPAVNSVKDLIALAKKQPGKLVCATGGVGALAHLSSELFKKMADIDFTTVHFKGTGPAIIDVTGGHSQFMFSALLAFMPHIKSGKLKVLGIGANKRSPLLPDVPTILEVGVPGYEASNWWGILAPAGTPKATVDRLHKELAVILNSEDTKKMFANQGSEAKLMGPAEFGKFIEAETAKWGKIVKECNINL